MMSSLFQREREGSSGGGGQEGGGERGVVSGPARLEEEAHPTTEQNIASVQDQRHCKHTNIIP